MKLADFNLLKKLMTMTESPVDAECLAAIRRANALLTKSGVNWDRVFRRLVTVDMEPAGGGGFDNDMEDLFARAITNAKGRGHEQTLKSIYNQWQRTSAITPAQRAVVERAAQ